MMNSLRDIQYLAHDEMNTVSDSEKRLIDPFTCGTLLIQIWGMTHICVRPDACKMNSEKLLIDPSTPSTRGTLLLNEWDMVHEHEGHYFTHTQQD